jgi:hypothetical protein
VEPQNSPLVHEVVVVTKDVGITCDLSNSSTSDSQPTNFILSWEVNVAPLIVRVLDIFLRKKKCIC